jgi:NAD(P)-dependent dehydrogenase (short-subunit alcohol dehydrogenase family)
MLKVKTCLLGFEGLLGKEWMSCLKKLEHQIITIGPNLLSPETSDQDFEHHVFNLSDDNVEILDTIFSLAKPNNLIINAGIDAKPGTGKTSLTEYTIESWIEIMSVNLFGLVIALNSAIENSSEIRNIVVVGSMYSEKSPNPKMYSHYGENGLTKHPAYSASKFAALSIVKQYAVHFAEVGILINMLSPGAVYSGQDAQFVKKISERIPLRRMASPVEMQSILKFLIQDNSYATGQNFVLDGGMNAW